MFVLSGTLRYWTDERDVHERALDRVVFEFEETWEPSLIVEEIYVAELDGLRVRLSEFAGGMGELSMSGRAIKVEGFRHAALVDWVIHAGGGALPQADMIDRALED